MVWRCWGWFSSCWRLLKGKLILPSSETRVWNLAPRFLLPVILILTTIGDLRLYPGKVRYRQGDYLSKMINRWHMHGNIHNLFLILMKADTFDLLNIVVTDHDRRSHKGLQSGFSLLPQETTDCRVEASASSDPSLLHSISLLSWTPAPFSPNCFPSHPMTFSTVSCCPWANSCSLPKPQLTHHLLHGMFLWCHPVPSLPDCLPICAFIYQSRPSNCLRNTVVYMYICISNRKGNNWKGRISHSSVFTVSRIGLTLSKCSESVISFTF